MRILFTCGGTGGHIYPAIALYKEFIVHDLKNQNEYIFVGSDFGFENEIFESQGVDNYRLIGSRGLQRNISWKSLETIFCNIKAMFKANRIFKDFRPEIVIATGAYPAFHMTFLAKKSNVPYFLIESNAIPGLVTKLFFANAKCVFTSSAQLKSRLKDAGNVKLTGIPSRIADRTKTKEQVLIELGLHPSKKTVTIMGGSCGSEYINSAVVKMLNKHEFDCQFIWSMGKKFKAESVSESSVKVFQYIENMQDILNATDLIISRAGAMTIQEIKEYHLPAILIPFSAAAGNHQMMNARELSESGVAEIIEESNVTADILYKSITGFLNNENRLSEINRLYRQMAFSNCNARVYREIMREM